MNTSVLRFAFFMAVYATSFTTQPSYAISENTTWQGIGIQSLDGAFDIRFEGRIHADWAFISPDRTLENKVGTLDDGAEIRRAWVYTSGTVNKKVVYKANVCTRWWRPRSS